MATAVRIGVVYQLGDIMRNALEDRALGARLADEFTPEHEQASSSAVELIERRLGADVSSLGDVVGELVHDAGCNALLGFVSVPNALQLAERSEAEEVLYFTPNNGPIWSGRRGVFYLGVPLRLLPRDRSASFVTSLEQSACISSACRVNSRPAPETAP